MKFNVIVVVEKDKDGYFAYVPSVQGCYSQGETYEKVIENIKDALELHLEDIKYEKENLNKIRNNSTASITNIQVTI